VPAPRQYSLLQTVGSKAVTIEQVNSIEVAPVRIVHARLTHPVPGGPEATTNPLGPVPLHLLSKGRYATSTNAKEWLLVHKRTSVKRGGANLQLHVGPHELGSEALPFHCLHQVLLWEATVSSLYCKNAIKTQLVHQPLSSLATAKKAVGDHDPPGTSPWLAQTQGYSCGLSYLVPVLLGGLANLALANFRHQQQARLTAHQRLDLHTILRGFAWLVCHVNLAPASPKDHRLVAAKEVASIPFTLPSIHTGAQQLLDRLVSEKLIIG
jgi:hypothetical protein